MKGEHEINPFLRLSKTKGGLGGPPLRRPISGIEIIPIPPEYSNKIDLKTMQE
jgi:hypothetical protein